MKITIFIVIVVSLCIILKVCFHIYFDYFLDKNIRTTLAKKDPKNLRRLEKRLEILLEYSFFRTRILKTKLELVRIALHNVHKETDDILEWISLKIEQGE